MFPLIIFLLPSIREILFLQHLQDGTWSTLEGCINVVRDFRDVCYHSYFSVMGDLQQESPTGKYYEIRFSVLVHLTSISNLAYFSTNKTTS